MYESLVSRVVILLVSDSNFVGSSNRRGLLLADQLHRNAFAFLGSNQPIAGLQLARGDLPSLEDLSDEQRDEIADQSAHNRSHQHVRPMVLVVGDPRQGNVRSASQENELNERQKEPGNQWTEQTGLKVEHGKPSGIERERRVPRVEGEHGLLDEPLLRALAFEFRNVFVRGEARVITDGGFADLHKVRSLSSNRIFRDIDNPLIE